jgi:micrococcal nuclease
MRRATHALLLVLLLIGLPLGCLAQDPGRKPEHQYVASSRGRVYYRIDCDAWKSLAATNLRYFRSASEAESAGYSPSQAQGCAPQAGGERIVSAIGGNASCTVTRIIDGDTFECAGGDRIRLLLIDTPELAQGPFGDSARRALVALVPPGTAVRLEFDVDLRDQYDRLLAYVHRDSVFVNRELALRGVAVAMVIPPNVKHVESIRAAVDSARAERRGLWRIDAFACRPEDFRAGRCRT